MTTETADRYATIITEATSSLEEALKLEAKGGPIRAKRAKLLREHAYLWLLEAAQIAKVAK
jgi:hypothetical protein